MMDYNIDIPVFEGPLDLLLHLIKQSNIDIYDIKIDEITKQYLDYINKMEDMNLNIASEYLVMAAELIEIKSNSLLPKKEDIVDEYEDDPRENLINRLVEYEAYKNITNTFKKLEEYRKEVYTKERDPLIDYMDNDKTIDYGFNLEELVNALNVFLKDKELNKPLDTKITNKEYSVHKRTDEIRNILKKRKKVKFSDLFDKITKDYIIVTFVSILNMTRKQEVIIEQENNFKDIIIKEKGVK